MLGNQEVLRQKAQIARQNGEEKTEKDLLSQIFTDKKINFDENKTSNAQLSARKAALRREEAQQKQILEQRKLQTQCDDLEKEIAFLQSLKGPKTGTNK